MSDLQKDTIHLSSGNPEVDEYMAGRSVADTVELKVTAQVREIADGGYTLDIVSAEALDFIEPMAEDEAADVESIAAVLGGGY